MRSSLRVLDKFDRHNAIRPIRQVLVMIAIASPLDPCVAGCFARGSSPTIFKSVPGVTSAWQIANPSISDLTAGG